MGVDIHEYRRVHDIHDRNPSSAGGSPAGGTGRRASIRQAPIWVQRKAAQAHLRRQASEADYKRRYLGA